MGKEHVLVTGGAGFIGSHVIDELLGHGYRFAFWTTSPHRSIPRVRLRST